MICIAGGTGLAPVLSIVRGAIAAGMTNPIHLYFGVRSSADVYGTQWLDALPAEHPMLRSHVVVASPSAPAASHGRLGVVTHAIDEDWKEMNGWRAYVAGSPLMVDAATLMLSRKGIAREHIYADAFYPSGV